MRSFATRTWREVVEGAARVAGFLSERGVQRGDVVVLMGTHHADLHANWLGCVWLGAVPSVLAEPSVRIDREVYWSRLHALLDRIDARALLTDSAIVVDVTWPGDRPRFTFEEAAGQGTSRAPLVEPRERDLLLLQHSSGTTGLHKGVMLSHGAVMRHSESYCRALDLHGNEIFASWLPLYHDMGLIACFVTPMMAGLPVVWLSPFEWVASPSLLLHAVSQYRATHVWLPNFAFSFLAQRVREPSGHFDLSSLAAVINCSEPVTREAMDAFAVRFAPDKLSRASIQACYAMAETVYAVSTSNSAKPPVTRYVDKTAWAEAHVARLALAGTPPERTIVHVSNGVPVEGCEVRIGPVGGGSGRLDACAAGRIWVKSTFLFDGYFRRPDLNADLFDAEGFFDTGDLGYVDEGGHIFVTGRVKDLVIIGGRNIYPHDVEATVNEVPGVHPGRVVVFGVPHRGLATEGLVVLMESALPEEKWPEVIRGVRRRVASQADLDLLDARVVSKGSLRKSTSGKLARGGNREWYLEGRFGPTPLVVDPAGGEPA
jgi:acyl-CoA synthetase (AMP-forming)/AMP-acid ligase II